MFFGSVNIMLLKTKKFSKSAMFTNTIKITKLYFSFTENMTRTKSLQRELHQYI